MLRVFTAFSGYDSQCMALERLKRAYSDFDYELVGWSEIDKYAIQVHNAVFPECAGRNYGDIRSIDWSGVLDFDLFTYSSPCQDFSSVGSRKGGEECFNNKSSLLWYCRKVIAVKRPKYLLFENVPNLVGRKFRSMFCRWQDELRFFGYGNFFKVLNAKDYGVPQNRKRVFMVSVMGGERYYFPKSMGCGLKLKDILEEDVPGKYFLSDSTVRSFIYINDKAVRGGLGYRFTPTDGNCMAKTITTCSGNRVSDNFIKGDRGIRKLTTRECFRLMGVSEEDIDKIEGSGVSVTQQYKLAGNSIVVNILYHIFRKMFIDKGGEVDDFSALQ